MPMLDFKGKQFVYAHHLSVPFRTLEIDAKNSLPPPGSKPDLDDHLIIHGDNLHALKALLPTYAGKVDCIIIDPPYNTGNEGWCYNDNVRSPLMQEWIKDAANPVDKEDLERHDKWCCMMWPRLKLLHELLSETGSLFVFIDDNEVHALRQILDEVFGRENFVDTVIWQKNYAPKIFLDEVKQGRVPQTLWFFDEVGHTQEAKREIVEMLDFDDSGSVFITPKPVRVIERILQLATDTDSIVLGSFAGSGTTAHAVLKQNQKDGGNRRFILVECEDYADTLTAERVRRVVNGYPFEGKQREELYRRKLNFTALKKADEILGSIEGVENLEGHRFDKIGKTVKNSELIVTGEKKVTEKTEGLGGSFTYCTLGEEINLQTLLSGEKLPAYDALAKYVFYTATGQTLPKVPKPGKVWFIGETTLYRVHLLYKPEKKWLRSNASALAQELVDAIAKQADPTKKTLVFASTKFMGQKALTRQHIEFCQLPYAIYRVLGD